jgi:Na+/proline symporter
MSKAQKYEQQMNYAMCGVIALCAGMVVLDIIWQTAGAGAMAGVGMGLSVSIYSFGIRTVKELKREIETLKSEGSADRTPPADEAATDK